MNRAFCLFLLALLALACSEPASTGATPMVVFCSQPLTTMASASSPTAATINMWFLMVPTLRTCSVYSLQRR